MNVYHNENFWGKGRHKKKLTAFSAGCSFSWCGQQLLIPAVYTGCARHLCQSPGPGYGCIFEKMEPETADGAKNPAGPGTIPV